MLTQATAVAGEQSPAIKKVLTIGTPIVPARDHAADDLIYAKTLASTRDAVDERLRLLLADAASGEVEEDEDSEDEESEEFIEDVAELEDEDEIDLDLIFEDDEDEVSEKPVIDDGVREDVEIHNLADFREVLKPGTRIVMTSAERKTDAGEWIPWPHPEFEVIRTVVRPMGHAGFEMDSGPDLIPSTDFSFVDGVPRFQSQIARMTFRVSVPPRATEDQIIAAALEKARGIAKTAPRKIKREAAYDRALAKSFKLANGDPRGALHALEDDYAARESVGWSSEDSTSAAAGRGLTRSEWEAVTDREDGGTRLSREIELNDAWTKNLATGLRMATRGIPRLRAAGQPTAELEEDRYEFALKLRGLRVEAQRLAERKAKLGMRGSE